MASDDLDLDAEEIDRLVQELSAPPRPAPVQPAVTQAVSAATEPAPDPGLPTPGRRWTTARLLMPTPRTEPRDRLAWLTRKLAEARASIPAIDLPALPRLELPTLPRIAIPALPGIPFAALPAIAWPSLTSLQSDAFPPRLFVGLGVLLSAAMPYWPYAHAWSWGLLVYFLAMMLVVVTGIWGAKLTWDARLPAAHTVSVGVVLWGVGLIAAEAVPRVYV